LASIGVCTKKHNLAGRFQTMAGALNEFNAAVIFLFYGLAFFIFGATVLVQPRKFSRLEIANHLKWLALFGFTHGLAEWLFSYNIIANRIFYAGNYFPIKVLEVVLTGFSFSLLLSFGCTFLVGFFNRYRWLKALPVFIFTVWLSYFVIYRIFFIGEDLLHWLMLASLFARYLIAFPGCILTGHSLWLQLQELRKMGITSLSGWFYTAIVGVNLYALAAGLLGPSGGFWPATWLNKESFYHLFGFPVEIVRMAAAAIITIALIQSLKIFDLEYGKMLDHAHSQQVLWAERERIGRDLHDGVLQSIYAVGLKLEGHRFLTRDYPELCNDKNIISAIDKLQEIVLDIRYYIQNLSSPQLAKDLPEMLRSLVEEYRDFTGNDVDLIIEGTVPCLSFKEATNMYHIVKEALTNISKHAGAKKVVINLTSRDSRIKLSIKDDGCGFDFNGIQDGKLNSGEHRGLRNMGQRMKALQGQFSVNSQEGQGTEVVLSMPVGGYLSGTAAAYPDC